MFGLFKKKRSDENQDVVVAAGNIVQDFADLMASDCIKPGLIYDVSLLPHSKGLIEHSYKLWISVCQDSYQRQCCKAVLVMLPQFQDGVGSTPLGLDGTAMMAMRDEGLSTKEMATRVTQMKMPSPELLEKVRAEERALLEWTRQVVDARP